MTAKLSKGHTWSGTETLLRADLHALIQDATVATANKVAASDCLSGWRPFGKVLSGLSDGDISVGTDGSVFGLHHEGIEGTYSTVIGCWNPNSKVEILVVSPTTTYVVKDVVKLDGTTAMSYAIGGTNVIDVTQFTGTTRELAAVITAVFDTTTDSLGNTVRAYKACVRGLVDAKVTSATIDYWVYPQNSLAFANQASYASGTGKFFFGRVQKVLDTNEATILLFGVPVDGT